MEELSPRQREIFLWVRERIVATGFPPTRAELQAAFGFRSPNAAESHLRTLARKGYLSLQGGTARGIRLAAGKGEAAGLPVIGRVAAGQPILAESVAEGFLPIDRGLFAGADYLLRVQGMSMRDAGILEGDLLAVSQRKDPRSGQIVVARVDNEMTVKRWYQEGHQVILMPENPDFAPITVDLRTQSLAVEGIVVGLLRRGEFL